MDIEKWKIRRLIKKLSSCKGNGTSVVTIMVPKDYSLNPIKQMLTDEYGTAVNIKSRVNRLSVLSAITSAQTRLKTYTRTPPNGLALFCGEIINNEGKIRKLVLDLEPPKPMTRKLYVCDNRFHTEPLDYLLEDDNIYGFIILDGNGVLYATLNGNIKTEISKFSVSLPKKHGRGGQSALRFSRLREEARHNYVRKVAENAVNCFITNDKVNVKGIIIAGSAELKTVFSQSPLLDKRLKETIIKIVDVSYGGKNGFQQAIELVGDTLGDLRFVQEKKVIDRFFHEIAIDSGKYCFGIKDTMNALEQGAVEVLILFQELKLVRKVIKRKECIDEIEFEFEEENINKEEENKKDIISITKEPLLDWFIENYKSFGTTLEIVSDSTSIGSQFCQGFGGIGGVLRWQVDFTDMYDDEDEDIDINDLYNNDSQANKDLEDMGF